MAKTKDEKLDPVSMATWARLRSAGKIAKPHGAEDMAKDPRRGKRKKSKKTG